jgi:hypothetical protein
MNDYGMLNAGSKVFYKGMNARNSKRFAGVVGIVESRVPGDRLVAAFEVYNRKTEEIDRHVIMVPSDALARIRA